MQIVRPNSSWVIGKHALMNLHIVQRNGRTEIDPKSWRIPYQWQGCHYQDNDDQPFLLTINSGGGFVEGDAAELYGTMAPGTRALITTTASSKFYKCPQGATSRETACFSVGADALLEYYPDPAILFADARVDRRTLIDLATTARLFAVDAVAAGRAHYGAGELFMFTSLRSELEIRIDGRSVALDRLIAQDREEVAALSRLWSGAAILATVVAVAPDLPAGIERAVEAAVGGVATTRFGVSRIGDVVICRLLISEAWACNDAIYQCWSVLRPYLAHKPARPIRKC